MFKNLITTLLRFKTASTLNIIGLSLAYAAFVIIIIQVNYDLRFDSFHPKADRIYRLEVSGDGSTYNALVGRNWAELVQQIPQVEDAGLRLGYSPLGDYVKIEKGGVIQGFSQQTNVIAPAFADIFDFEMVEGSRDALLKPDNVILPQSIAQRYWPDRNAVGQPMTFVRKGEQTMTVGGVYRDFPQYSLVGNIIYYGINQGNQGSLDGGTGWNFNYDMYVTLPASVDKADIERQIMTLFQSAASDWAKDYYTSVRLNPLSSIHYSTDVKFDTTPKGSAARIVFLLSIALLIIVIAAINFINFSMALTPMRIKSINTHKILGGSVAKLRTSLIVEAVGISLIASGIALLVAELVRESGISSILIADISLTQNMDMVALMLAVAIIVGLAAGLYPAIYSTRFAPVLAIKGSFGLSARGRALRTALISFQYVISIALIVGAIFMHLQNRYLRSIELGYDTSKVVVAQLNDNINHVNRDALLGELRKSPQVENVAFSQFLFGTGDAQQMSENINGEMFTYAFLPVTDEFLDVMDIKVSHGRNFRPSDSDSTLERKAGIFNDAFAKASGLELGFEMQAPMQVVGFIDNINFRPLQTTSNTPFCLAVMGSKLEGFISMPWAYFRITGDPYTAIEHIKRSIAAIDPAFPVNITFYDQVFDNIYNSERQTAWLITAFSLLAVVISLVGVFGLVAFETQYKRREIGLKRVYGSTIGQILVTFNVKFVCIVLLCSAVAMPMAWWGVQRWLSTFAYRTPIHWWVFLLALVIVLFVTVLTVTIQSWKAATDNPVHSLKSE